jgi:hypothetical protein
MVTIGDAFSIVATLAGVALTAWSFILAFALLFPSKVESARSAISLGVWKCLWSGLAALAIGAICLVIVNVPNPLAKLIGLVGVAFYFGLVGVGTSGISKLAAERLRTLSGQELNLFASYSRASAYIVLAGILPILGWFLFAPLLMVIAGGAGLRAVLAARRVGVEAM